MGTQLGQHQNYSVYTEMHNVCKGTYACVGAHMYTYGNYTNTVANVDASDSRCRCIGNIIARDLRLVTSRLYRMTIPRPVVTCRHYIIPLFRRRPPGLHTPYKRKGKESIKQSCRIRTLPNSTVALPSSTAQGDLPADPPHGETPRPIDCDPEVVKPVPTPCIPGRDPMK